MDYLTGNGRYYLTPGQNLCSIANSEKEQRENHHHLIDSILITHEYSSIVKEQP
jgi:hypothetical protein